MTSPATREFQRIADEACRQETRLGRLQLMDRVETFVSTIEENAGYDLVSVSHDLAPAVPVGKKATGEQSGNNIVAGRDLLLAAGQLVEQVSALDQMEIDAAPEPVLTVQELSERFHVSTKTIERWRRRGLIARRFRHNGRSRIGFFESSVRRFTRDHAAEIDRGRRFHHIEAIEREEIIRQAHLLARHGTCITDVCRRLADRFSRSAETIRYTLLQHDSQTPEDAVFTSTTAPLTAEQKFEICQKFRRGVPVERLAKQIGKTKATVYRIIAETRAAKLLGESVDYMDSPEFHTRSAASVILADAPVVEKKTSAVRPPAGLPPYLASLYAIPLLTREEEQYYFRKMNFLKFRAATLQQEIDPKRPRIAQLDDLEAALSQATEIKNFLIRSNLRLVVSIAKKHIKPTSNFFEMVSDGNMSLIRAIEKFDYTKGNKFSTYATWAIMKNFARSIPAEHKRLDRFRTGKDEVFQHSMDGRANPFQEELTNRRQNHAIMDILGQLDHRERDIILFRYGLGDTQEPLTLEQVGQRFGVTKERIRQLESRALRKLRKIAEEERLDIPGIV